MEGLKSQISSRNSVSEVSREVLLASRFRGMAERIMVSDFTSITAKRIQKYIEKANKLDAECMENYILAAKLYIKCSIINKTAKMTLLSSAAEILNKALKYDPINTKIKTMLAEIYFSINNIDLAVNYLDDVIKVTTTAKVLEMRADCSFASGNIEKALEYYSKSLNLQPRSHKLLYKKAHCLHMMENFANAYVDCRKCLLLMPRSNPAKELLNGIIAGAKAKYKKTAKEVKNQLESQFDEDDEKHNLFLLKYEVDPLTGLANEHSMNIFKEQCKTAADLATITLFINDIRLLNMIHGRKSVNDLFKDIAVGFKDVLNGAVFFARSSGDRYVAFVTRENAVDLADKLVWWINSTPRLAVFGVGVGIDKNISHSIEISMVAAITNAKGESCHN